MFDTYFIIIADMKSIALIDTFPSIYNLPFAFSSQSVSMA